VPVLDRLIDANRRQFAKLDYRAHGSLLFGDLGTLLVATFLPLLVMATMYLAVQIEFRPLGPPGKHEFPNL
jgi:hypothetical protein